MSNRCLHKCPIYTYRKTKLDLKNPTRKSSTEEKNDLGGGGEYPGQDPAQRVQHEVLDVQGGVDLVTNAPSSNCPTESEIIWMNTWGPNREIYEMTGGHRYLIV
jgi:hypothetical protein